jgi:ethanolaminephosphotransferase
LERLVFHHQLFTVTDQSYEWNYPAWSRHHGLSRQRQVNSQTNDGPAHLSKAKWDCKGVVPSYCIRDEHLRRRTSQPDIRLGGSLSESALHNLKSYKYSSVDKSYLSYYILRHYWNGFVKLLPLWLAPNMVTLLGFFFILGNVALLEIYVPDLVGPAPNWVYVSFGMGVWMYSTMDNVDGKQARRTGTSSPLGELFDHGIDSLNCTLASLLETAALAQGPSKTGSFTALVPCLPMFFSTWETFHTHTLYLGYFNGPTEGLLIVTLMMLLTGIWGPDMWATPITTAVPLLSPYLDDKTVLRDIWVPMILGMFLVAHLPSCVLNVAHARAEKGLPVAPLFLEWFPMLIFTGSCMAWLGSPHSHLLSDNHLVLFCLTMSLVFGRMTTKIILAHLTRQPFPYWTILLAPLIGGALLAWLPLFGFDPINSVLELRYLQAYFVFAAIVYGRWAYIVINTICRYLGINALTIPNKPLQENGATANGQADKRVD